MISASLNRCKGMEDQVGDFLKQLAAKLTCFELALRNAPHEASSAMLVSIISGA